MVEMPATELLELRQCARIIDVQLEGTKPEPPNP